MIKCKCVTQGQNLYVLIPKVNYFCIIINIGEIAQNQRAHADSPLPPKHKTNINIPVKMC